jgi:ketosteroid isomerase-like protein
MSELRWPADRTTSGRAVVRKPLSVEVGSRRTFEERVALRWPWLPALGVRVVARLPPRSKLRQALIWRAARQGAEAFNRRDIDAVLISKHPDIEYEPPRDLVEFGGLSAVYRGHAGYAQFVEEWLSAWGAFRGEPTELVDFGDRLVLLAEAVGRGKGSGIPVTGSYAVVLTLRGAWVFASSTTPTMHTRSKPSACGTRRHHGCGL